MSDRLTHARSDVPLVPSADQGGSVEDPHLALDAIFERHDQRHRAIDARCVDLRLSGARLPAASILIVGRHTHRFNRTVVHEAAIEQQPFEIRDRRRHQLGGLSESFKALGDRAFGEPGAQQR